MSEAVHPGVLVAVAQFAPTDDDVANLTVIDGLARRAAARGARVVVFPEYASYFHPAMDSRYVTAAQPLDGAFVRGLAALAIDLGVHLIAGLVETATTEKFSNTLVAVGPEGTVVATYRKLHLYDAFGGRESDWIIPGDIEKASETFEIDGLRFGLETCYDLRFPEVTRVLVDAGVDVVLVPAEWVRGPLKEHHWRTLVTARAIENTIYVAAADHTPPVGVGNSMVVDPFGVEVATIGDEVGIAVGEVRAERLQQVRSVNPALALRRFRIVAGSPRAVDVTS